jgi:hypothetical protein
VSEFLSDAWLAEVNERLARASGTPGVTVRVVFEFDDSPSSAPHAMTFSVGPDGAAVAAGDHLAADLMVRLTFADARRLAAGELSATEALREGRLKLRGDVNGLSEYGAWMTSIRELPSE